MIWHPTAPISPDVTADPRVINVAVYVAIAMIVVTAFPHFLGPLRKTWETWTQGARRAQDEEHKADITALNNRVEVLSTLVEDYRSELEEMRAEHRAEVNELRGERDAHNDVLTDHAAYDQRMIQLVIQLGGTPLNYKPLWPTCPKGHPQPPAEPPHDGGFAADLGHP